MATAFFRTVILYLLLIAGLRITGKRQIGELEPIELVLTMLLSDLASVPMQDFGIPLVNGIVPIVTLLSLSMLLSYGSLRSVRFRTLLCGEPTLIIRSGHILQDAMRRNRLTVDELLEALRGQGISDLQEVKYAVLETSGQLSVLPRADCQPVTPRQLSLQPEDPQTLPTVVISDGRLLRRSMERLGLDDGWLQARLRDAGVRSPREVFLLSVDEAGSVVCLPMVVIKKDGSRQSFDRSKILRGIQRSCEKRPVPVADMERMASEIEQEVQNSLEREVSTEIIGEKVMEKLKKADEVAYVRFASVYRQFKDINTFMSELNKLLSEK